MYIYHVLSINYEFLPEIKMWMTTHGDYSDKLMNTENGVFAKFSVLQNNNNLNVHRHLIWKYKIIRLHHAEDSFQDVCQFSQEIDQNEFGKKHMFYRKYNPVLLMYESNRKLRLL